MVSPSERIYSKAHRADLKLKLPWLPGQSYECIQGNDGGFTHNGLNQYAWDFALPEGTAVAAAAAGRVVRVKQDSAAGGTSHRDYALGNVVILDHGRGLFTQYLHLRRDSVKVREGQIVRAGTVIAASGNTGYSSVPHLHFQVQDATGQSLPATFEDVPGDGNPRQGNAYASYNNGQNVSAYESPSPFPMQAFESAGIIITATNLPGHLLSLNEPYKLQGYTQKVPTSKRMAVYIMGPQGGKATWWTFADVDDAGRFAVTLDLTSLPTKVHPWSSRTDQSNCFALAVAPVLPDGSFWSKISVPVTVR